MPAWSLSEQQKMARLLRSVPVFRAEGRGQRERDFSWQRCKLSLGRQSDWPPFTQCVEGDTETRDQDFCLLARGLPVPQAIPSFWCPWVLHRVGRAWVDPWLQTSLGGFGAGESRTEPGLETRYVQPLCSSLFDEAGGKAQLRIL